MCSPHGKTLRDFHTSPEIGCRPEFSASRHRTLHSAPFVANISLGQRLPWPPSPLVNISRNQNLPWTQFPVTTITWSISPVTTISLSQHLP
ncbi:hypothetical protein ElyMa_004437200 [Elysia marginata]|uniref:Uncharacterized protein n=1 Tax=Elysia marginata TaxID=1093978 RepID=A0AAV4HFH0_9GAST|nr:hypothetical protein ElyMa_004437200 [Elysia marginata]